jgi:hypothetical protein
LNKTLNKFNTNDIPSLSDDTRMRNWPKGRPELPLSCLVALEADEQLFQAQRHDGELDDLPESSDEDEGI